jgi:catechol 2,3-dioxygenase-like lactoylglutathione lyase family enzyme
MRVIGLDHVVLNVTDVERSLSYYCDVLGLTAERVEEWRQGDVPFPSVRIDAGTIIDLLEAPRAGGQNVDHLCLVLPAADWEEALRTPGIEVVRPPAELFGARGSGMAFYTRDPDANLIELRHYCD